MLAILSTLSASANIIPQADVYWDQIITKGEVSGPHHARRVVMRDLTKNLTSAHNPHPPGREWQSAQAGPAHVQDCGQ